MKLESTIKFKNDNRVWKCVDVETVIQHPNELQIYTLSNEDNVIRLTQHEIEMNT